jgi:hypothetical protein
MPGEMCRWTNRRVARAVATMAIALASIAVLAASAGCGYALAGRGSFLPSDIRVVGVPVLENRTTVFQADEILTEKIRTEFIGRGKYSVRPQADGVDAVLSGQILGISLQPVALNDQQIASRYVVTLSMRVQFTDVRSNTVLWSNEALTFREEYNLALSSGSVDGAAFLDQERSSFDRIAADLARTVVTAILEAF